MSADGACACARGGCGKTIADAARALWRDGLPYCSGFCFDREHHGKTPDAGATAPVELREERP